jgi:hypothetical protein
VAKKPGQGRSVGSVVHVPARTALIALTHVVPSSREVEQLPEERPARSTSQTEALVPPQCSRRAQAAT